MNKKNNRKGFTIIELVIVIAVIAILATVLVPTFSNIIEKAQNSAALQEARSIYTNYVAGIKYEEAKKAYTDLWVHVDDYYVEVVDSAMTGTVTKTAPTAAHAVIIKASGETVTVEDIVNCTSGCDECK